MRNIQGRKIGLIYPVVIDYPIDTTEMAQCIMAMGMIEVELTIRAIIRQTLDTIILTEVAIINIKY